jgi:hypothetical protein
MPVEMLNYRDLGQHLGTSPEAARALSKRLRIRRQLGNDGKTRVAVDFAEISHKPKPVRSPAGQRPDDKQTASYAALTARRSSNWRTRSPTGRLPQVVTGRTSSTSASGVTGNASRTINSASDATSTWASYCGRPPT